MQRDNGKSGKQEQQQQQPRFIVRVSMQYVLIGMETIMDSLNRFVECIFGCRMSIAVCFNVQKQKLVGDLLILTTGKLFVLVELR